MIAIRARYLMWVASLGVIAGTPLRAAPPTLEYLFPSGGRRGTTVEVTASGKFDAWPVAAWSDRAGLSIEADKSKGKLNVVIADDAAGVYWLRLHNKDGATVLRPFVVGSLPEVVEAETNDDPVKPQQLESSCVVNGKLAKSGDVDGYSIRLQRGQTLVVSMTASRVLGSPMDAVVQLCDENGFVLAQNDDGGSLDPHLVFDVPVDGTYLIRSFAFPETPNSTINFAGGGNFIYRLTITAGGFLEYGLPMSVQPTQPTALVPVGWNLPPDLQPIVVQVDQESTRAVVTHPSAANDVTVKVAPQLPVVALPDLTGDNPQPISIPCIVSGALSKPGAGHLFSFETQKGTKIDLRVESRSLGLPLDAVMRVTDATGKLIKEVDDASKNRDPQLTLSASKDAEYRVEIRDLHGRGGKRFAYRLTVAPVKPSYTLSVAADVFQLEPGKELEIAVTCDRQNGFGDEVQIEAVDLPAGVTVTSAPSSKNGTDTAKTTKLKLKADAAASSGSFRIVGRSAGQPSVLATFSQTAPTHQHADLWLHVPSANGDKK